MLLKKDKVVEPESITTNVDMGIHKSVRAYMAAYNSSQASRVWNIALREAIVESNPYMEVFIPQIDLAINLETMSRREVQACYEKELDKTDIVILILEEEWKIKPGRDLNVVTRVLKANI